MVTVANPWHPFSMKTSLYLAAAVALATGSPLVGQSQPVLEKGSITVPENRSRPGSRLITLPYQRLQATDPTGARPLFVFNGGPGSSNFLFGLVPDEVRRTRDVVAVGYRGVDGPSLLPDEAFTAAFWGLDAELSEANLRRIAVAYSRFLADCRAQGIDPQGYTPDEVVADAEALRAYLGYDTVDLFGQSYGTRLTYLYGRDYPASVHRIVMTGANPPGHFVVLPSDIDDVVRAYGEREGRDWQTTTQNVSRAMPASWLWWPIDRGKVKLGSQLLLGNPDTAATVFDAYAKAERGDGSALVGLTLLASLMTKGMHAGDLFLKGLGDFEAGRDYLAETSDEAQIGRAFLRGTFGVAQLIADADLTPRSPFAPQPIDAPTLVLNGDLDPQTPLRGVQADMMPLLRQGHLLVLKGYGHQNAVKDQPGPFSSAVTGFLDEGLWPTDFPPGTVPQRPAFDLSAVGYGATALVIGAVVGLGTLVWWFLFR